MKNNKLRRRRNVVKKSPSQSKKFDAIDVRLYVNKSGRWIYLMSWATQVDVRRSSLFYALCQPGSARGRLQRSPDLSAKLIFWSIVRCGRKNVHVRYLIFWWVLVSLAAILGVGKLESMQGYCEALFGAELRPNLAWAWCCSQKRPYFLLGIQDRPSPITCDETTLYWTRLHIRIVVRYQLRLTLS